MSEEHTREALLEAASAAIDEIKRTCWQVGCVYLPYGEHYRCAQCPRGRVLARLKEATAQAEGRLSACRTSSWSETRAQVVLDELGWLWREYVMTDPATLTKDAQGLAKRVERAVRNLVDEVDQTRTVHAWDEARAGAKASR